MSTFNPNSTKPYRLSRSKIENFMKCPRCFYLDRRLGVPPPPSFPFNLNSAVDTLLKKEFDLYRASGTPHPLMKANNVNAVPFAHDRLDEWREALRGGVRYIDPETNLEITGAPDDVWINAQGELIVVDYKATSKIGDVSLDADWQKSYKRQVEVYQWLLRKNHFTVSNTAYFVYANGDSGADAFNHCLRFNLTLLPYQGDDTWVQSVIRAAHACLLSDEAPAPTEDCEWCDYRKKATNALTALSKNLYCEADPKGLLSKNMATGHNNFTYETRNPLARPPGPLFRSPHDCAGHHHCERGFTIH